MSANHSPGPWTYHPLLTASENHKGWIVCDKEGSDPIAEVYPFTQDGDPEQETNAALIASAPELGRKLVRLLTALREFLIRVEATGVEAPSDQEELIAAIVDCGE